MNRIEPNFRLLTFMNVPERWGRAAGGTIHRTLMDRLGAHSDPAPFRISMMGVRRIDVTFATVAIVEPIRQYLGTKSVCLVDLADQDIFENIAAAADRLNVPLTIWNGDRVQMAGPPPSSGLREALDYALNRTELRAAELARAQRLSITNASTKLKQLWAKGYLMRDEAWARSGGAEFVYRRIG